MSGGLKRSPYSFWTFSMPAVHPIILLLLSMAASDSLRLRFVAANNNIMQAGYYLPATAYLSSGNYTLVMQLDCNLVIYVGVCCTQPTWASGTWNTGFSGPDCRASMRQDGNLIVSGALNSSRTALWGALGANNSSTGLTGDYYLILESDGFLKIMDIGIPGQAIWSNYPPPDGAPAPAPPPVSTGAPAPAEALAPASTSKPVNNVTLLFAGDRLLAGSSLVNKDVRLTLESDCNLRSSDVRLAYLFWETGNHTDPGVHCELVLQKDSTLQVRSNSTDLVIWEHNARKATDTEAQVLVLNDDGNVDVMSTLFKVIWTWPEGTQSVPPFPPTSNGTTPPSISNRPSKNAVGTIAAVIGGILGGLLLLGVTLCACIFRQQGYFDKDQKELQLRLQENGSRARALTLSEIRKATKNNERLLGRGGFGPVYYGRLQDGQEIAVKLLSATSNQGKDEFCNEIELLSVVHHKFLVSLVGYCIERKQRILVYEYMGGGDVRNRLHGESASTDPLSWSQRKNIILQVAEGIQYLHEGCKPAIIHRDIKTNNILLDERMVAKVADFGLSKLLYVDRDDATHHITTAVKGTTGYLDPEYYVSQKLTEKSDVYAYGVLLMEILTGRSLLDSIDNVYIVQKVRTAWKSKNLDGLADPSKIWEETTITSSSPV